MTLPSSLKRGRWEEMEENTVRDLMAAFGVEKKGAGNETRGPKGRGGPASAKDYDDEPDGNRIDRADANRNADPFARPAGGAGRGGQGGRGQGRGFGGGMPGLPGVGGGMPGMGGQRSGRPQGDGQRSGRPQGDGQRSGRPQGDGQRSGRPQGAVRASLIRCKRPLASAMPGARAVRRGRKARAAPTMACRAAVAAAKAGKA
jgi:23S rRNA pseudouridine2605 synthase